MTTANRLLACLIAASLVGPAFAAPGANSPGSKRPTPNQNSQEPSICASLANDLEEASKKLALNVANGVGDNSAPRATMREAEDTNTLAQAKMTMDVMHNNGCKGPSFVPSASRYGLASLTCATAKQKIRNRELIDRLDNKFVIYDLPAECDTQTWKPNGK